ncbi:MAG: hypothetical protein HY017_33520 [Betaproteobacteria bacterium]|nr:hypothetical protein [Betaproteobacteria bacterium]
MKLLNLHGLKRKRRARKANAAAPGKAKAKAAAPRKTLDKMTPEQIEALPEREFVRLLNPSGRRLYHAAKKLKDAF